MRATRLAVICEYATLNGGERSMLSTLAGVQAAGFAPVVMAPPDGPLAETLDEQGIPRLPFRCRDADGKRISQARLREELASQVRQCGAELLHANSLSMGRLSGPVAAALGVPSVAHLRDIVTISRQAVADLNCHARLLAVSEATRAFHVARGLSAEKTHVLRNGVDLRQFRPRSPTGYLHRELNIPAGAPLVGNIGQIGLRKGQNVLIAAAAALAGRLPEFHCLFVGRRSSGKEESRRFESDLRAAVKGPLTGRVHFVGQRCDIEALLPELTLLVHAARQEPLGRVLLEAAACGVAVVATDVGGTREIFPPATRSAQLVLPDRPDDLAAAMAELLGDPSERRRLGIAARRRAEAAFDVRDAVAGLVEHYRAVPGGRALRPLPDRAVAGLVEHYRAVQRITAPAESPSTGSTRTSRRDRPARGR